MIDDIDGTYGYTKNDLLRVGAPNEPEGFAEFWRGRYADALAVDVAEELIAIGGPPGTDLFEVRFSSLHGVRIGGWLAVPRDGDVRRGVVVGHGYGGRDAPDLAVVPEHTVAIFPVARGLPTMSVLPDVAADSMGHVLTGIDSVDTYIHGGCAADLWCAATVVLRLYPGIRLAYIGGSFGGGVGALALPWDARFSAAVLHVPSFGNHDLRLTMPCFGSGEAVRGRVAEHPGVRDVLRFFDAATAARRLTIPTLVAPALCDAHVPPPGQFAVYNVIRAQKELYVFSAGHQEYDGDQAEYERYLTMSRAFVSV